MNLINVLLQCTHITQRKRAIVLVAIRTPGITLYCQRCGRNVPPAPTEALKAALRRNHE